MEEVKETLLPRNRTKSDVESHDLLSNDSLKEVSLSLKNDNSHIINDEDESTWKLPREQFERAVMAEPELKNLSKRSRNFYKQQNDLVESFFNLDKLSQVFNADDDDENKGEGESKKVKIAIYASFATNIALFCLKIYAAIASGSMSVIASALDSFLDLLSGSIIFLTNYAISKKNVYRYPAGKERLEPLGLIVFSACMFTFTLQLITKSVQVLVTKDSDIHMNNGSLIVIIGTVVSKFCLWLYCRLLKGSASVTALAQDHFNDVLSNSFGLVTALVGNYLYWFVDPLGGIFIGLYIMTNWFRTGYGLVTNMTGKAAPTSFIQQLTYVALNHDKRIIKIDTVRAFHLGLGFMVEVDIVLPEDMPLREAHDIGESLQIKLEQLSVVERAFVHLDYDYNHKPEHQPDRKLDLVEMDSD